MDSIHDRQVVMPSVGKEGQAKLARASVAVVGTGGLGSPILLYLAAAGVGRLRFIDNDNVDRSNLNRQVLHRASTVGHKKVDSARKTLEDLAPGVELEPVDGMFDESSAKGIFSGMDYVIDASDNFETKFLVNDVSVAMGIPATIGGVVRWDGQLTSVLPGKTTCYRCIFSKPPAPGSMKPPSSMGIIGVTAGITGIIAAAEAIKHLLGFPDSGLLRNRLLMIDLRTVEFTSVPVSRNPDCSACKKT